MSKLSRDRDNPFPPGTLAASSWDFRRAWMDLARAVATEVRSSDPIMAVLAFTVLYAIGVGVSWLT